MTLLDDLETALSEVADVRVATRFSSPRLRFPNPNDLRIFIPDIHLMPSNERQRFFFTGAHPEHALLKRTLTRLGTLRASVKAANPNAVCATYFMGDFIDLWRCGPQGTHPSVAVDKVALEHQDLLLLACGPALRARFLLGNHDFDLCKVPSFAAADRRYFFPPNQPSVLAIHGDVFDWVEDFPDLLNEVIVYYLSPFSNLLDHMFERVKGLILASNEKPEHLGAADVIPLPNDGAPAIAVVDRADAEAQHSLFRRALESRDAANAQFGLDLRAFVIGHTHGPRIVVYESGPSFFALVDTGGWLEDVRNNAGAPERGMITGMCGNEIRIFELQEN